MTFETTIRFECMEPKPVLTQLPKCSLQARTGPSCE